ncbi:MAG: glycosyl transferase, partial [Chromatiaceae bacterium]
PVAAISLLDDGGEVRPRYRLASHLGAGVLLMAGGLGWSRLDLPGLTLNLGAILAVCLTLLLVVWMINLYNFMDGMDGLAGGMAIFGFGALATLGWRGDELAYAMTCASIAATAGGFLTANFPPARLFLGDLGSTSLGLLAAALALQGSALGLFPLWVAGLAFSPFILDATATLVRRAFRGDRLWQAHRSHHYQRLVLAGWSHRRVMLRAWALMAACAACAVAAPGLTTPDQWLLLAGWAAIYALIGYRVRLVERLAGRVAP